MLAGAFLLGMVISLSLAWAGLFGAGLPVTKNYTVTGKPAKVIGLACALFGLGLLGAVIWAIMSLMNQK